jgi:WhiB family transcriptional regulator, redox-sensing transcriptional regulator
VAIIRFHPSLETPCSVDTELGVTNAAAKVRPIERADRTHWAVPGRPHGTSGPAQTGATRSGSTTTRYDTRNANSQGSTIDTITRLPQLDDESHPAVIRTVGPRCADGNGTLTPLFFSDDLVDIGRAKAICAKCMLRANCLADAIDREEPWGVWGGELVLNGRIVTSKQACGRPPKRPRPQMVIDEMGIVAVESVA